MIFDHTEDDREDVQRDSKHINKMCMHSRISSIFSCRMKIAALENWRVRSKISFCEDSMEAYTVCFGLVAKLRAE